MPTLSAAFDCLTEALPGLVPGCRRYLYVGVRQDTHPWWRVELREALGPDAVPVAMDISEGNLRTGALNAGVDGFVGDLRYPERWPDRGPFDLVIWDEGPEHLPREEAIESILRFRDLPGDPVVAVSCPWGFQKQGSDPSSPEFHHWGPEISDFFAIGMAVSAFGTRFLENGCGHGNLVAWLPRRTT